MHRSKKQTPLSCGCVTFPPNSEISAVVIICFFANCPQQDVISLFRVVSLERLIIINNLGEDNFRNSLEDSQRRKVLFNFEKNKVIFTNLHAPGKFVGLGNAFHLKRSYDRNPNFNQHG